MITHFIYTTQKLDCIEINILSHYETWIIKHIHKLNKKTDLLFSIFYFILDLSLQYFWINCRWIQYLSWTLFNIQAIVFFQSFEILNVFCSVYILFSFNLQIHFLDGWSNHYFVSNPLWEFFLISSHFCKMYNIVIVLVTLNSNALTVTMAKYNVLSISVAERWQRLIN